MDELYDIEHSYKEFIYRLRKCEIEEPYIIVGSYSNTRLKDCFRQIQAVELIDTEYSAYYGQLKTIVNEFMIYYCNVMDTNHEMYRSFSIGLSKKDLMQLIENTFEKHAQSQKDFIDEFLPIESAREQNQYDEIITQYDEFLEKFSTIPNKIIVLSKQQYVDEFVKEHFETVVFKQAYKCLDVVRLFISVMLADRVPQIRISLNEIARRMNKNLGDCIDKYQDSVRGYINELYDVNKEKIQLYRKSRAKFHELAEINKSIECILKNLSSSSNEGNISRIQEEIEYWGKRLVELDEIVKIMKEYEGELARIVADEERLANLRSTGEDVPKTKCCLLLDYNFEEQKAAIKTQLVKTSRCLLTFLTARGEDHNLYLDRFGYYTVDEFNHRIYTQDYTFKEMDIDCEGNLVEFPDTKTYYFDEIGRYIIRDGKKIYQVERCTSEYELGDYDLLKKITKDCGHSEHWRPECAKEFHEPEIQILPSTKPVNIEKTLDVETVKYLWDTFGWILPEVLKDVCTQKPQNPIHLLAHKLLFHKYHKTRDEMYKKPKEAFEYRSNFYKKEREDAIQTLMLRKSKMVKRRKPEESDVTDEVAAMVHHTEGLEYIAGLSEYYNN